MALKSNVVYCGDCLELMPEIEDNSIDAVITDPPYGLKFMGKDWDRAVPSVDIWREVLRVMKPGAFAAILCTPRQDCQARMILNLGAAGFATGFTSILWTYATGLPKAGNLSKLIDKRAGVERSDATIPATKEAKALDGAYAGCQPKPAFEPVLIVMKPLSEKTYIDQALDNGKGCSWLDDCRVPTGESLDGGAYSKQGERSPSSYLLGGDCGEYKQPSGRFPANVLCSDNVMDDGRVQTDGFHVGRNRDSSATGNRIYGKRGKDTNDCGYGGSGSYSRYFDLDRWWAERIEKLPEEVRRVFPWLIVPKASKKEKGQDNKHPTVKPIKLMSYLVTLFSRPDDLVLDPFAGSGTTALACKLLNRNFVLVEEDEESCKICCERIDLEEWEY